MKIRTKKTEKLYGKNIEKRKKNYSISGLLQEYDIETAEGIQETPKDLLGRTIKEIMETEMDLSSFETTRK